MTYSITDSTAMTANHKITNRAPGMALRWLFLFTLIGFLLMGCANMSSTQQRTLSGGAIGATGGAVVGAIAGDTALGAVVGAAAGAAGGYLYDKHEQSKQKAYEQGRRDGQAQRY